MSTSVSLMTSQLFQPLFSQMSTENKRTALPDHNDILQLNLAEKGKSTITSGMLPDVTEVNSFNEFNNSLTRSSNHLCILALQI